MIGWCVELRRCVRVVLLPGAAGLIGACACALAGGCAAAPGTPDRLGPEDVIPLESRIDAFAGRTLLVPVRAGAEAPASVPVTLENGRVLAGRLWRITVEFPPAGAGSWLAPSGAWRATGARGAGAVAAGAPGSAGTPALATTMVVVELPLGVQGGKVTVARAPAKLNVLTSLAAPGTVASRRQSTVLDPAPGAGNDSPLLARLLEPERRSPVRRWRYLLWKDGLVSGAAAGAPGDVAPFDDAVIEALAEQEEARWSWALRALARVEPPLAERLARRLVSVADFGEGVGAPAWPTSQADLDSLLFDLLDPDLSGAQRAQRGAAFLGAQAEAGAWVIDDAGTPEAVTGNPTAAVGAANLGERPVLAAAGVGERAAGAGPTTLAPSTVTRLYVPPAPGVLELGPSTLDATVGAWRSSLAAFLRNVPVMPPGLTLGPFWPDYTLDSWTGSFEGRGAAVDGAWASAAVLLRKGARWTLFVECARPADVPGAVQEDTVRVWVGPTGRTRLVVRVGESGYAHVEQSLGPGGEGSAAEIERGVVTGAGEGRWVCEVPLPAWCVDGDGIVRVGLERTDARGGRWGFPRAMLPWQGEPGRVAVDTTRWERGRGK